MTDETNVTQELLPCPKCEGHKVWIDQMSAGERNRWCGTCDDCDYAGETQETREKAIAVWNTRTANSTVPDGLELRKGAGTGLFPDALVKGGEFIAMIADEHSDTILSALTHTKSEPASNAIREALEKIEKACDNRAAETPRHIHLAMIDAGMEPELEALDEARRQARAALSQSPTVEQSMLDRVVELRKDEPEAGFWIACSGCQESDEGYLSEELWPHSKVFKVQPGSGCTECGGLGVLWDDTDYEAFGKFITGDENAPTSVEQAVAAETLQDVLDQERYKVALALQDIRKAIDGRRWLSEGGRGSYTYDDERYQQEFGAALDEIAVALEPLRKIAGDWSNCPTDPLRVAANRSAAIRASKVPGDA